MSRILIVEDESHLAYLLRTNLELDGHAAVVATTLGAAHERLREGWELILLDLMLPDGSGLDFCEALRQRGDRTPVLMLTARGELTDCVTGFEAGADDYLTKPFALEELRVRIAALLRRREWSAPKSSAVLQFGDAVVNFGTREVMCKAKPVALTDLEFRMLAYFAENRDIVVSREALLAEVWGVNPEVNTRTVDNFIVRLRKVFESDPRTPRFFHTVRGAGYRFTPQGPQP
jgi:DNA-binding response OmpR family regulator